MTKPPSHPELPKEFGAHGGDPIRQRTGTDVDEGRYRAKTGCPAPALAAKREVVQEVGYSSLTQAFLPMQVHKQVNYWHPDSAKLRLRSRYPRPPTFA